MRVFNVSPHKCATSSLHKAFAILGFRSHHYETMHRLLWPFLEGTLSSESILAEDNTAFGDVPLSMMYRDLYALFPNDKYLFVYRDGPSWIRSFRRHVEEHWKGRNPIHTVLYGYGLDAYNFDEKVCLRTYERLCADILEFFSGKSNFLGLPIERLSWESLCPFLEKQIPLVPFPVENSSFQTVEQEGGGIMATKDELLEKTKELIKLARDYSATPPNPFDAVSGTPALDALKLNGQVISDEDLTKLLNEVEKAKLEDETWKKVAGTIGGFVGGLAKGVILPLLAVAFLGCSTPPPIKQASQVEYEALVAFKSDHDAMVTALFSDLALALETQVRLIEDYEIKAKGATVAQADLLTLLGQARTKREDLTKKLDLLRAKLKTADRNFEIALQIQQSIDAFLNRSTFSMDDVASLIGTVYDLKGKQAKP